MGARLRIPVVARAEDAASQTGAGAGPFTAARPLSDRARVTLGRMRATKRKRPPRRAVGQAPEGVDVAAVAAQVRYVGSAEHKSYPSSAGPPKLRADASKCDPMLADFTTLTDWLRDALRRSQFGTLWEGGFPRYAWYRVGEVCYEARLMNQAQGEYKGYPLEESEWPPGI